MTKMVVFVVKRYAVRIKAKKWRHVIRNTKTWQYVSITLMVMDCGINFIRFRIPDQVYCKESQKKKHFV